jgi:hypothetical protein
MNSGLLLYKETWKERFTMILLYKETQKEMFHRDLFGSKVHFSSNLQCNNTYMSTTNNMGLDWKSIIQ